MSLYKCDYSSQKNDIDLLLSQYGLCDNSDKLVKELSMGMKKKVSLICALAVKPDILVLDEPTCALDDRSKTELSLMIANYASPSATVICTSHDGEFINMLPDYKIISFPMSETV